MTRVSQAIPWALAGALALLLACPANAQAPWPRPGQPPSTPPPPPPRSSPPPASQDSDYDTGADAELARTIALLGTLVPVGAGAVTWAVQGDPSVTSWLLIYLGSVEGPALGYRYAGLQRAANEGEMLRGVITVAALLVALDRKTDDDRDAALGVGSVLVTALAVYDANRLPSRMYRRFGARLQVHPALVGERVVPAVTLRF